MMTLITSIDNLLLVIYIAVTIFLTFNILEILFLCSKPKAKYFFFHAFSFLWIIGLEALSIYALYNFNGILKYIGIYATYRAYTVMK